MQAFDTTDAKKKLAVLSMHMPGCDEYMSCFGRFLATRLNPQLVPMGFVIACELALLDVQKGIDGFTNKPLAIEYRKVVGMPPFFYDMIRVRIPEIARAVLTEEQANAVRAEIDEVNAEMKAQAN